MIVELTEQIVAMPTTVWACLTTPIAVSRWFGPHMQLDARPGGGFTEIWNDGKRTVTTTGEVLCFEPPHRLHLSWRDADWPVATEVSVVLESVGHVTRLRLRHAGWDALGKDGAALAEAHRAGWQQHLQALRRYAEAATRQSQSEPS